MSGEFYNDYIRKYKKIFLFPLYLILLNFLLPLTSYILDMSIIWIKLVCILLSQTTYLNYFLITRKHYTNTQTRFVNAIVDKSDLTADEKREIDDLQTNPCYNKKYRNKWPEIAKKLSLNRKQGRRTELQIKNYWNSKERTQKRKNKNKERSYERISNIMNIKNIIRDV